MVYYIPMVMMTAAMLRSLVDVGLTDDHRPSGGGFMSSYTVRIRDVPSIPVAVVRRVAKQSELATLVPECCGVVWNELKAQQTKGGRHIAIYWDGDIRLEVGAELQGPFVETTTVVQSATPAGRVATVTHLGPYSRLGAAHNELKTWCDAHGHQLAGPSWEIYGHWQPEWNGNPALIRTDVYYQLAT